MADKAPATTGQKPKVDTTAIAETPAGCTKAVEPNKMVFFYPTPDQRQEIYIPRGQFQKALELSVQKNWEELCKFPAYTGQGYEEWD
ncbi:uncharacterized protein P174DRAFT_444497 [Aspergillus novofumigatus IBT 16806]|uniref:Uncharacterized protein n=1 Tax=Aspergillus novofumigatus (strain IBT 16806) TaxID=1392255 RepID=A0A2I1BZH1_ASPN1|nr:uncharacterized protein P174DRAFT_444497 [Aspergillus novofumigatus IBT 16806]PKX90758.1 hypothetical protein P174DRAFT_444497 [Aspergillus novofumigatus IBT 16806]